MKVRSLLVIGVLLALAIVGARVAVLLHSSAESARLEALSRQSEMIARDAASLQALTMELLAGSGERAQVQWRAQQRSLADALDTAQGMAGGQAETVRDVAAISDALLGLYEVTLARRVAGDAGARDVLADQLVFQTRRVSIAAFDLGEQISAARLALRERDRQATVATVSSFGLMVLVMALFVWRRLLRPLQLVEKAAAAIAAGRFDARSGYAAADEYGAVARRFDAMAESLQDRELRLADALRANESLLDSVRQHAIVSVTDWTGRIVEVNDNFCRASGYAEEELLGQNHRILNSGLHDRGFWREMWSTIAAGQPWHGVVCNRAKDGSLFWVDSYVTPFLGSDGRVERYVSIRVDVTAAKQLEAQLAQSERFQRQMTDALPLRIAYIDRDRTFRLSNRAHAERYGRGTRESVVGRRCAELIGGPDHPAIRAVERALDSGERQLLEFDDAVGGQSRRFELRVIPDLDERGRVRGALTASLDITERQHAEAEALRTSALLQDVIDSATEVAIIVAGPDGRIRLFNRGAERLLGLTAAEVVGVRRLESFDAGSVEIGHGAPGGSGAVRAWRRGDGRRVPVSVSIVTLAGAGGGPPGKLAVAHDLSSQIQVEASLRQAADAARQADAAKSRFLAGVSHEIRTPMNAVIGLSYLLAQTRLDEEQAATLKRIRLASDTLLHLLNDVLDLSKIEAGELTLEVLPFRLRHLLRDLAEIIRAQAEAQNLDFEVTLETPLPELLEGDPTRLRQVLDNLLSNALKFTEAGAVTLAIRAVDGAPEGRQRIAFQVRDTGIGIAAEAQDRLFQPFTQADASVNRRFGGTGLGLSIVRHLVQAMGGTIALHSTPGAGSVFTVEIEFAVASPAALTWRQLAGGPEARDLLAGVRVLVVDDNEVNRDVAARILQLQGAKVRTADDGDTAVELLRRDPQGFDLVLMDVQMPRLDGYAATRAIRRELGLAVPVLALTAAALSSEQEAARAAGMHGFIAKPFDPPALLRTVREHLRRPPPLELALGETPPSWPVIEGMDTAEAERRMGGDRALFARLLSRLLAEHSGPGAPSAPAPAEQRAARLHKLRGAAATLGCTEVAALAADAEHALRAGEADEAEALLEALDDEIARLARASAGLLSVWADVPAAPLPDDREVGVEQVLQLLRQRDLAALDAFRGQREALEARLGGPTWSTIDALLTELRFDEAALRLSNACAEAARERA